MGRRFQSRDLQLQVGAEHEIESHTHEFARSISSIGKTALPPSPLYNGPTWLLLPLWRRKRLTMAPYAIGLMENDDDSLSAGVTSDQPKRPNWNSRLRSKTCSPRHKPMIAGPERHLAQVGQPASSLVTSSMKLSFISQLGTTSADEPQLGGPFASYREQASERAKPSAAVRSADLI